MAAFTTLAAGALGYMVAKKLGNRGQQQQPVTAPGPTAAQGEPQPPIVNPAADQQAALGAAGAQRKKAARGMAASRPIGTGLTSGRVKTQPKTLVGY